MRSRRKDCDANALERLLAIDDRQRLQERDDQSTSKRFVNERMYADDTLLIALFTFWKSMESCDIHPAKLPRNSIAGWVW